MKDRLKTVLGVLALLAVGGFLVAASGIVPIKASSGHWAITRWFLRFGMERSTATHSLGIETPDLNDRSLVLKGAGHYETGCRSCHGAPGAPQPPIARAMTPTPPELVARIREDDPAELFHVVKHGIKFTGMPAWTSQPRDDEVWAMVAFLLELPRLDMAGYRELVHGAAGHAHDGTALDQPPPAPGTPARVAQTCARCHGHEGEGRGDGAFPRLAGQRRDYLVNALDAYARGKRHSGIMQPVAAPLSDELIRNLSDYYAALDRPLVRRTPGADRALLERGRAIAERGIPERRVPSCIECHGPKGTKTKPAYPSLAGQYADYLLLQLRLFKNDQRGGSDYAHLMDDVVHGLEPDDMRAVAAYFASIENPNGTEPR